MDGKQLRFVVQLHRRRVRDAGRERGDVADVVRVELGADALPFAGFVGGNIATFSVWRDAKRRGVRKERRRGRAGRM